MCVAIAHAFPSPACERTRTFGPGRLPLTDQKPALPLTVHRLFLRIQYRLLSCAQRVCITHLWAERARKEETSLLVVLEDLGWTRSITVPAKLQ